MDEYIERKSIINAFKDANTDIMADYGPYYGSEWGFSHDAVKRIINSVPAADVAPVVHGRWILEAEKGSCVDFYVKAHCSECSYEWFSKDGFGNYSNVFSAFVRGKDEDAIEFVLREAAKRKLFGFCPVCGAKMDKEEADD